MRTGSSSRVPLLLPRWLFTKVTEGANKGGWEEEKEEEVVVGTKLPLSLCSSHPSSSSFIMTGVPVGRSKNILAPFISYD